MARSMASRPSSRNQPDASAGSAYIIRSSGRNSRDNPGLSRAFAMDKACGLASVGFHLQHISGVLDRLLTYAKGLSLSESQFAELSAEGYHTGATMADLLKKVDEQIRKTVEELKRIDSDILTEKRDVGRKKLPSTVLGLIFHSAEHTMRHVVQLLVTATLVKEHYSGNP